MLINKMSKYADVMQLVAGVVAFSDKVISKADKEEIGRIIKMTTIGKMFYDEQIEAIRKDEERIARNLLASGLSPQVVSQNIGLELSVVENLASEVQSDTQGGLVAV